MSAALVYKSASPRVTDWFRDLERRNRETATQRSVYVDQLTKEFGAVGKRYRHSSEEVDHRPLMRNSSNEVTGVLCRADERPPKGSGWRLDSGTGFWKPDLRTNVGKERAAELEDLKGPSALDELSSIGASSISWTDHLMYRPGIQFREDTGELYIIWGSKDCEDDMLRAASLVEDVAWEQVPLSEWHAWREELEAERVAS